MRGRGVRRDADSDADANAACSSTGLARAGVALAAKGLLLVVHGFARPPTPGCARCRRAMFEFGGSSR